ncbi:hypothetical protein SUGI_0106370 [Cryptomeria japonica]|nr:hypothetical protein SUGI_0106370 [Cryptomeria japonica]
MSSSSNNRNASKGGEANFDSKAGRSKAPAKSTAKARPAKKEPPRERPVSKFHDLLNHGVKIYDDDANEFYDALVKARIELDKELDAMDAEDAAR